MTRQGLVQHRASPFLLNILSLKLLESVGVKLHVQSTENGVRQVKIQRDVNLVSHCVLSTRCGSTKAFITALWA